MEVLGQVQALVQEHAFTIGVGLLVAAVIAAVAWFWMSRGGSSGESKVLENQARMSEADMAPGDYPPGAVGGAPPSPITLSQEEMEAQRMAAMAQQQENASGPQMDE